MIALMLHIVQGSFWGKWARRKNTDVASRTCFTVKGVSASGLC